MASTATTDERKAVYVRLAPEAYEQIVKLAEYNNRSQGMQAAFMLEELLAQDGE